MSPMPGRNPYRPGVGVAPLHLAGRDGEVRRLQAALREAPSSPANVRVTGLRGVGKSVLLGEFERVAADEGWAVGRVDLEHRYDTPDGIVSVISIACQRVGDRMSRPERTGSAAAALGAPMAKVEADFEDVKADLEPGGSDHDVELARVLYDATVGVTEHGRAGLAILMDEAHVLERPAALSVLMSAVLTLQRQMVPIALVVSGLPHLLAQLRQARGYDENMFRGEVLGPLDGSASREALERPLDGTGIMMDADLVDKVVAQTEGYPNFIQVWGTELWEVPRLYGDIQRMKIELFEKAEPRVQERLDVEFYEPRVRILTSAERGVLIASAECPYPPLRVEDLAEHSQRSAGNIDMLFRRMVAAGVLYRLRQGEYYYTAPRFHEFLERRES